LSVLRSELLVSEGLSFEVLLHTAEFVRDLSKLCLQLLEES